MSYTLDDLTQFRSQNKGFMGNGNDKMDVSINNNIKELLYFTQLLNAENNVTLIKNIHIEIIRLKQLINIQLLYDNIQLIKVFKQISNYNILPEYIYLGIGTAPLSNHSEFFPDFLVQKVKEGKSVLAINIDESFDPMKGEASTNFDFITSASGKIKVPININDRSIKSLKDRIGIDTSKLIVISNDILDFYYYFDLERSPVYKFTIFMIFNIKVNAEKKDDWFIKEIYKMIKTITIPKIKLLIYRVNCAGGNLREISSELRQLSDDELYQNVLMEPYILATFPLKDSEIKIGNENCKKAK